MNNPDRLYDLLPAVYRQRDEERGRPLQGLLRVIGEQVEVVEADIRRLYENWFIETCDDWVVPYIGDLLGFQLVHEAGQPGDVRTPQGRALDKILIPRHEVAHTIGARRRRGTLALLEELARDVAGWPTRAVEFYELIGVTQAINQLQMGRGRTVDVRDLAGLELLGGAFNPIAHTADVRRVNSHHGQGRSSIPSAGLFVWRLRAYRVSNTPASCIEAVGENCFTFSVLGNNSPLFTRPQPESEPTHIAGELNVPAPIQRRRLAGALTDYYGELDSVRRGEKSVAIRAPGWPGSHNDGWVPHKAIVVADLGHWKYAPEDDHVAVDPKRGRMVFPPDQLPPQGVWVSYYYGFSADIGGGEYRRPISQQPVATVFKAAPGELGARLGEWKAAMPPNAVIELTESEIYEDQIHIELPAQHTLQIRAANGTRPIIRLLDRKANQPDALSVTVGPGSRFVLDGLLITGRSVQIKTAQAARANEKERTGKTGKSDTNAARAVAKVAAVEQMRAAPPALELEHVDVIIRHCTLVPGWELGCDCEPCQPAKPSLELSNLQGRVSIKHSIVGSIRVQEDRVRAEPIELRITDSVVDATSPERSALCAPGGVTAHAALTIARSTVFGEIHMHAIGLAENCIFIGEIRVARRQIGCVRFCFVTPGSRTPRRYECQPDLVERAATEKLAKSASAEEKARAITREQARVTPRFNSVRYGSPIYCQLAPSCAEEIARGADDESEMGVFHDLFQPQRAINLRARLDEFTPAGMDAGIIYVT